MGYRSIESAQECMKAGAYEAVVRKCEEKTTDQGYELISIDFQMRADVQQEYKNKHFFLNIFKEADGSLSDKGINRLGKVAHALGIPKDSDFDLPDLIGRCCILNIRPFTNENGITKDSLYYAEPTKAGQYVQSVTAISNDDDEDMPF